MSRSGGSRVFAAVLAAFMSSWLSGCERRDGTTTWPVPPRADFAPVSAVLAPRCGTLDCHGNPARNLRVYGEYGLRASGSDTTGGADTTADEVSATYASIVSVHPEILNAVFAEQGAAPERWIVVSKGRGRENHEGGTAMPEGSLADRCLISWVAGALDRDSCLNDTFGPVPRDGETW